MTGVVSNFVTYGYDAETSTVRFGTTGSGVAPNYKIEESGHPATFNVKGHAVTMTVTPGRTFSGRNHREMSELDNLERHDCHWSRSKLTFDELKTLLSHLSQTKAFH